ncbi:Receptor-type tyrosine-protein phosphatase F [Durusdinium trenchii]|uniref:Receptor-type tyrosine-protein phosphatase F n=1 Tax=Durusdinium trenchii TaxID=1381693 RepID=A0ABP0IP92_9DINO
MARATILLDDEPDGPEMVDLPMRLVGLTQARQLNGQVVVVKRFVTEKQRYEVELWQSKEVKSVQVANLECLPVDQEVGLWAQLFQEAKSEDVQGWLNRLEKLPITTAMLAEQNLPKVINAFAKRFPQADTAMKARQLIHKWRHQFRKEKEDAGREERQRPVPREGTQTAGGAGPGRSPEVREAAPPAPRVEMVRMSGPEDGKTLASAMRSCGSEQMRMGLLSALDKSAKHSMLSFIQNGGLEPLTRWLKQSQTARYACLVVLQKLPVTLQDLQKGHLIEIVEAIQKEDDPKNRAEATALLDRWKAAGFIQQEVRRPAKRLRAEDFDLAQPDVPVYQTAQPTSHGAQPRTPPLQTLPAARPEFIPRDLQSLDPRIVKVLLERPQLHELLQQHPDVLHQPSPEALACIRRLLSNSQQKHQDDDSAGCTITVSRLSENSTEEDVSQLLVDIGLQPKKVTLPRESKRKKSCGTAFVLLPSKLDADKAVERLHGAHLNEKVLVVNYLDPTHSTDPTHHDGGRRVQWKPDSQLWEAQMDTLELKRPVIVFSPDESVETLRRRIDRKEFQQLRSDVAPPTEQSHPDLNRARSAQQKEESEFNRKALAALIDN